MGATPIANSISVLGLFCIFVVITCDVNSVETYIFSVYNFLIITCSLAEYFRIINSNHDRHNQCTFELFQRLGILTVFISTIETILILSIRTNTIVDYSGAFACATLNMMIMDYIRPKVNPKHEEIV